MRHDFAATALRLLLLGSAVTAAVLATAPVRAEAPATAPNVGLVRALYGERGAALDELLGEPQADRSIDVALSAVAGRIRGHLAFMRTQHVADGQPMGRAATPASYKARVGTDTAKRLAGGERLPSDAVSDAMMTRLLQHALRHGLARAEGCYERQLLASPELNGTLSLHVVYDANGTVASAAIAQDTLGRPELGHCVLAAVRHAATARPLGDRVLVELPLVFAQK